jgi:hypothetical protein
MAIRLTLANGVILSSDNELIPVDPQSEAP